MHHLNSVGLNEIIIIRHVRGVLQAWREEVRYVPHGPTRESPPHTGKFPQGRKNIGAASRFQSPKALSTCSPHTCRENHHRCPIGPSPLSITQGQAELGFSRPSPSLSRPRPFPPPNQRETRLTPPATAQNTAADSRRPGLRVCESSRRAVFFIPSLLILSSSNK